jgi:hypothetical protein
MTHAEVLTTVVAANLLCGTFLYGVWRLNRDERDVKGIIIVLLCCGLAVIAALAAASS